MHLLMAALWTVLNVACRDRGAAPLVSRAMEEALAWLPLLNKQHSVQQTEASRLSLR